MQDPRGVEVVMCEIDLKLQIINVFLVPVKKDIMIQQIAVKLTDEAASGFVKSEC
jgi:hypothetical protein